MLTSVAAIISGIILFATNFAYRFVFHGSIGGPEAHEGNLAYFSLHREVRKAQTAIAGVANYQRGIHRNGNVGSRPGQGPVAIARAT